MCVVCFGALAFALQLLVNRRPDTGTRTWLEIAAASLSFVVIPAVWRIRVSAQPLFSTIPNVNTFNYVSGSSGTSNGASGSGT